MTLLLAAFDVTYKREALRDRDMIHQQDDRILYPYSNCLKEALCNATLWIIQLQKNIFFSCFILGSTETTSAGRTSGWDSSLVNAVQYGDTAVSTELRKQELAWKGFATLC